MRSTKIMTAGLVLSSAFVLAQTQTPAPPYPDNTDTTSASASQSDHDIQNAINQKFDGDAALKNVKTQVKDGKVVLSGIVPTNKDRNQAKQIAQSMAPNYKVKSNLETAAEARMLNSSGGGGNPHQGKNQSDNPRPK